MIFSLEHSPWSGREGEIVTSRKLRERLFYEQKKNVSLRIVDTEQPDSFQVTGRGEFQLAIIIETMRREGYELQVSKPPSSPARSTARPTNPWSCWSSMFRRLYRCRLTAVGDAQRKDDEDDPPGSSRVRLEFSVPSRGLIGFRSRFLTDTRGTGIMNALFDGWAPWHGAIRARATARWLPTVRGRNALRQFSTGGNAALFLIPPGARVYEGMVVGEYSRDVDLNVNICREKS